LRSRAPHEGNRKRRKPKCRKAESPRLVWGGTAEQPDGQKNNQGRLLGSWQPEEIAELCRDLDLVHCVDPFQAESVTRGLRYYRLHGIGGYRYEYTDEDLRTLFQRRPKEAATYFMFNNVSMFDDAVQFRKLLK